MEPAPAFTINCRCVLEPNVGKAFHIFRPKKPKTPIVAGTMIDMAGFSAVSLVGIGPKNDKIIMASAKALEDLAAAMDLQTKVMDEAIASVDALAKNLDTGTLKHSFGPGFGKIKVVDFSEEAQQFKNSQEQFKQEILGSFNLGKAAHTVGKEIAKSGDEAVWELLKAGTIDEVKAGELIAGLKKAKHLPLVPAWDPADGKDWEKPFPYNPGYIKHVHELHVKPQPMPMSIGIDYGFDDPFDKSSPHRECLFIGGALDGLVTAIPNSAKTHQKYERYDAETFMAPGTKNVETRIEFAKMRRAAIAGSQ